MASATYASARPVTAAEWQKVTELASRLADLGCDPTGARFVHNRVHLLRYLRARSMNVTEADLMLRRSMAWRDAWAIDARVEAWRASECHAARLVRRYWYGTTHGRCDCDVPVAYTLFGAADPAQLWREAGAAAAAMSVAERAAAGLGVVPEWTLCGAGVGSKGRKAMVEINPLLLQTLSSCETMLERIEAANRSYRRAVPRTGGCDDPDAAITSWIEVVDLSSTAGFGFDVTWLPRALRAVGTIRALAPVCDANYPEVLRRVFIIRAPSLFVPIHATCSALMDEATNEKVRVYASSVVATQRFVDDFVDAGGKISALPPQIRDAYSFEPDPSLAPSHATLTRMLCGLIPPSGVGKDLSALGGFSRWTEEEEEEVAVVLKSVASSPTLLKRVVAAVASAPDPIRAARRASTKALQVAPRKGLLLRRGAPRGGGGGAAAAAAVTVHYYGIIALLVAAVACAVVLVRGDGVNVQRATPIVCVVMEMAVLAGYCSSRS